MASAAPPVIEDLELFGRTWFVFEPGLEVTDCSCGSLEVSLCREVCTGDDECLLAVSRDVVRGEMRPVYIKEAWELEDLFMKIE